MVDLIIKKREGGSLTREEIAFWIDGYVNGIIPDYQTPTFRVATSWMTAPRRRRSRRGRSRL